jgi:dipeptidyl aminopeptidase/acylaminoacyl peptidase
VLPGDYKDGKRIPLMVQIHGGPNLQWANEFYADFHIYAGLGYASLGANIRGSSGYGEKLLRALIGEIGGGEYEDLMSGVDHVIDLGIAAPDRLCVRGWSWGGCFRVGLLPRLIVLKRPLSVPW